MIYTLGESLVDIIFQNKNDITAKAGGGMLNTAVSLGRSGAQVSLISEVGDDETAKIILEFLSENSVDTKYIKKYYHQKTSVALAFLNDEKIPSFSIYKSYPDKRRLIFPASFSKNDILVFGSLYSLSPEIRSEIVHILTTAKNDGAILCYDPNIRHHDLSQPEIRRALEENINFANIVKASDEDFKNIFGLRSVEEYFDKIRKLNPETLFVFTKGADGIVGFYRNERFDLLALETDLVSTIGAGDAFNAGIVYSLNKIINRDFDIRKLKVAEFQEMLHSGLRFSAAVCATMDNYVPNNFL